MDNEITDPVRFELPLPEIYGFWEHKAGLMR